MRHSVYRTRSDRISLRIKPQVLVISCLLTGLLLALFLISLSRGSADLTATQIWDAFWHAPKGDMITTVIWQLRLPRLCAAALVGGMLGLSGAILQGVTRNPLADPSLVGVSQGASLCVVALIVLVPNAPLIARPFAAFVGALSVSVLVQWIATGKASAASLRFILVGIGVSATISAGTSAMLTYGQINQATTALSWLAGSVHRVTWAGCSVLLLGLMGAIPALLWAVRPLSGLSFGPEIATGLGLRLRRDRYGLITLAVTLSALAVSVAGPLGFVGLISAQIARRLCRAGQGAHLVITALSGACLVTLADLIGRTVAAPVQFPAGLIAAIIGAPMFVALIFRRASPKHL